LGYFDYVTVDAQRRRVYASHTGSQALMIVDADSGAVLGQVQAGGPTHGVAVDPASGRVFIGNGTANSVSAIDPVAMKVVATVAVGGPVDALTHDATLGRIYADEDDGPRLFVIDAKTMTLIKTLTLPAHKLEYLAVDPQSHVLYQNLADRSQYAVVDPHSLEVSATVATPELVNNHPLQYDPSLGVLAIGGSGMLSVYGRDGVKRATIPVPSGIDQCDLDPGRHLLACAGGGKVTLVTLTKNGAQISAQADVPRGVHTLAIDRKTGRVWVVWATAEGSFVQGYTISP
jgi:YVTN family beta-propeller protein